VGIDETDADPAEKMAAREERAGNEVDSEDSTTEDIRP
jgi:hypothetical protein